MNRFRRLLTSLLAAVVIALGLGVAVAPASAAEVAAAAEAALPVAYPDEVHLITAANSPMIGAMRNAYDCPVTTGKPICFWTGYYASGTMLVYYVSAIQGGRRLPSAYRGNIKSGWNHSDWNVLLFKYVTCSGRYSTMWNTGGNGQGYYLDFDAAGFLRFRSFASTVNDDGAC
jgi:hypothetical protein